MKSRKDFRIVFMGTPAFAVSSLEILYDAGYDLVAVVTAPDKPAGRGLVTRFSAVKQFALQHHLSLLQPFSLKDQNFIKALADLQADLFVVVAFRMLPEAVWSLPAKGTINLHASLLPQYRGAAPINWAIINGEYNTGVTTFLIDREIDTGKILKQQEIRLSYSETAGELHDRLMENGAKLLLETVDALRSSNIKPIDQKQLLSEDQVLKKAPKLTKEDCRINWSMNTERIYNHIRGLSPYPAAFTNLISPEGTTLPLKIYKAIPCDRAIHCEPGDIVTEENKRMFVASRDGFIELLEIQLAGKSRMKVSDFLNGFRITAGFKAK
jgi:methionyl-tRNA formyltransferase